MYKGKDSETKFCQQYKRLGVWMNGWDKSQGTAKKWNFLRIGDIKKAQECAFGTKIIELVFSRIKGIG